MKCRAGSRLLPVFKTPGPLSFSPPNPDTMSTTARPASPSPSTSPSNSKAAEAGPTMSTTDDIELQPASECKEPLPALDVKGRPPIALGGKEELCVMLALSMAMCKTIRFPLRAAAADFPCSCPRMERCLGGAVTAQDSRALRREFLFGGKETRTDCSSLAGLVHCCFAHVRRQLCRLSLGGRHERLGMWVPPLCPSTLTSCQLTDRLGFGMVGGP